MRAGSSEMVALLDVCSQAPNAPKVSQWRKSVHGTGCLLYYRDLAALWLPHFDLNHKVIPFLRQSPRQMSLHTCQSTQTTLHIYVMVPYGTLVCNVGICKRISILKHVIDSRNSKFVKIRLHFICVCKGSGNISVHFRRNVAMRLSLFSLFLWAGSRHWRGGRGRRSISE